MNESSKSVATKIWWRHWGVVLILAIVAGFVVWVMLNLGGWFKNQQEWRAAKSDQEQLDKLSRHDKYGGSTPQKTLDLFIGALEDGNIEVASKYFVIEKQELWAKTLATYKNQALLDEFIRELRSSQINENMFEFYPSLVWKINIL
ncbi:MAG: hypothetical protein A2831_00175 [Candidatus Yanofskybacteria bacterium RIFCSPHIGHO2_01_FULL_44_17]|uniref:Uncharacterized protein n=1 Tax=Candidatus Yanofskybacteria bacterium RIFCSPHIGHO2_01_FULL_44_17 TaxID=1802668 RepID=A0A1F8EW39_9BACT|nr:MAG: hypothetical protein A2831_00175 [Candidatus Yanofskybacteria bacterium RIFCSPHIGHO2_01_FULL_44_17]